MQGAPVQLGTVPQLDQLRAWKALNPKGDSAS